LQIDGNLATLMLREITHDFKVMNIYSVLESAANTWPDKPGIIDGDRLFNYQELYAAAETLAAEFRAAGLAAGDKLALLFPNSAEFVIAVFAALRLKAIIVPVPATATAGEVADLAREVAVDAFCYHTRLEPLIPVDENRRALHVITPARLAMGGLGETADEDRERLRRLDAAVIRFSSGTTAAAKGIVISHRTLFERMHAQNSEFRFSDGQVVVWMQPMAMTLAGPMYALLSTGSCLAPAGAVDIPKIAELLRSRQVAQIYASPLSYRMMASDEAISVADARAVNHFISTSAPLSEAAAEAFHRRFGREIAQYYGSGECARASSNLSEDISKRGSIGRPAAGYEFRLEGISADASGPEAVGELLLRGKGLFDAYYRPWRLRDEVLEDGWFRTGDMARRDADGYYWIVGRTKEVINVAGVKVFPRQLEEILLTHPAVEEALVYGAPEPRFGEGPRARVKLRAGAAATEKEILDFANHKVSVFRMIRGLEFVEEIPKTATGKSRRWNPARE